MKSLVLTTLILSISAMAQEVPWSETFKIPEGITYRAHAAGFDCGTFSNSYVKTPEIFSTLKIQYQQLAADKDLNTFLIEATYPGSDNVTCTYGVYLDRNRDDKTLDFNHSVVSSESVNCEEGKSFIDAHMAKAAYEPSKRGIRYIAVQIMNETNEVCENGIVRMVFDRRK